MNSKVKPLIILIITVFVVVISPLTVIGEEYKGPEFCSGCHPDQYEEWSNTMHAIAFEDSVFQKVWSARGQPSECLTCHTTGFEEATGEYAFEGVTCESCHGPFKPDHFTTPGWQMEVNLSAELCGQCHTDAHHPTFEEWSESAHAFSLVGNKTNVESGLGADWASCASRCHSVAPPLYQGGCMGSGCHSAEGFLLATGFISNTSLIYDEISAAYQEILEDPTATEKVNPVTCQACHDPHNVGNKFEGEEPKYVLEVENLNELCSACHRVPSKYLYPDTFEYTYAWEELISVETFGNTSAHKIAGADCISCHMATKPYEAEEPESKWANTGHSFEIWTYENGTYAACMVCHRDTQKTYEFVESTQESFKNLFTLMEEKENELSNVIEEVKGLLEEVKETNPEAYEKLSQVLEEIESKEGTLHYLAIFLGHDGGLGIHNPAMASSILSTGIKALEESINQANMLKAYLEQLPALARVETVTETYTLRETVTERLTETTTVEKTTTQVKTATVTSKVTETLTLTETPPTVTTTSTITESTTLTSTLTSTLTTTVTEMTGYYLAGVFLILAIILGVLLARKR